MIPVFLLENVVYLLNLLSINSIFILTLPLVFFVGSNPPDPEIIINEIYVFVHCSEDNKGKEIDNILVKSCT